MNYLREVDNATSVKAIGVLREPTLKSFGEADFGYRQVFSVFDYGTIEPPIPLDNSTVCLMQGFNFELLGDYGVQSHYQGLVTDEGELISAKEAISRGIAPTTTRVKFVNRIMPVFNDGQWDYSMFGDEGETEANNYVLPIEFMSRNSLPDASSVWGRVEGKKLALSDLGLPEGFKRGDPIPDELRPILDYSTKFEPDDRYLSRGEVQQILGFQADRFALINGMTAEASELMTEYAESRGFRRHDGKVEYVTLIMDGKHVDMLGDAVCTWHEDRLVTPQGVGISKQRIRNKVKQLNPIWYAEIQRAKAYAREHGVEDFRTLMDPSIIYTSPSPEFFHAINALFRAGTNQWVGAKVYDVFPSKQESLEDNLARAVEEFERAK